MDYSAGTVAERSGADVRINDWDVYEASRGTYRRSRDNDGQGTSAYSPHDPNNFGGTGYPHSQKGSRFGGWNRLPRNPGTGNGAARGVSRWEMENIIPSNLGWRRKIQNKGFGNVPWRDEFPNIVFPTGRLWWRRMGWGTMNQNDLRSGYGEDHPLDTQMSYKSMVPGQFAGIHQVTFCPGEVPEGLKRCAQGEKCAQCIYQVRKTIK